MKTEEEVNEFLEQLTKRHRQCLEDIACATVTTNITRTREMVELGVQIVTLTWVLGFLDD